MPPDLRRLLGWLPNPWRTATSLRAQLAQIEIEHARLAAEVEAHRQVAAELRASSDTLERAVAERTAELQQAHERLRTLYDAMAAGVLVQGPNGEILEANRAAAIILGRTMEALRGRNTHEPIWKITREDGSELSLAEHPGARALLTRQPVREIIIGVTRADGQHRWVQVDSVPRFDATGEPVEVVSSLIDVTARKQAELALRESEARLHSILGSIDDVVWSVSPAYELLYLNRAAERLYGRPAAAFFTNRYLWHDVIHPDDRERFPRDVEALIAGGSFEVEHRIVQPDDTVRWVVTRGWVVRDAAGAPLRLDGVVTDVTHRRERETLSAAREAAGAADVLDPAAIAMLRELHRPGHPDPLGAAIGLFLANEPPRLATLRAAVADGDAAAVQRAAHQFKGSAGTMGAGEVMALSQGLEQLARGGTLAGAEELMGALESALARACVALERLRDQEALYSS
jgi:PAS domain S-box-containing protein